MKTGGIVVCSTFVALVYIPEYPYGRSVTHTFWAWPRPVWRMPPGGTAESVILAVQSEKYVISESMVLAPFLLPPWSSSIRLVIPCSHVRVFARRLGQ